MGCGCRGPKAAAARGAAESAKIVYIVEGGSLTDSVSSYDYDEALGLAQDSGGHVRSALEMVAAHA